MYKWFLAARYLRTKLIAVFGILAVTLCVAMVLVVVSVMGGFLDMVRKQAKRMHAEMVVDAGSLQGFPFYEEFGEYLKHELPSVVRMTTPSIKTYGIFRVPQNTFTSPARVLGIRLDEYVQVNGFGEGLHYNAAFPGTTFLGPQRQPIGALVYGRGFQLPEYEKPPEGSPGRLPTSPAPSTPSVDRATSAKENNESPRSIEYINIEQVPYPRVIGSTTADYVYAVQPGEPGFVGPEFHGAIVGADLLFSRGPTGDFERYLVRGAQVALTLMPITPSGQTKREPPALVPLRYVDDSRTGIYEVDSMHVYVDFELLQHTLGMDAQPLAEGGFTKPRASELLIGLQKGVALDEARDRIMFAWHDFQAALPADLNIHDQDALQFVEVYSWEDLQRSFLAAVEKEKILVTLLFGLISLVAVVLIGCIFYMIVEKKTRDIGILKSVGASARGIACMFILYAAAIGMVGSLLGTLLGSVFIWNINDIQDWLASLNPALRVWNPEIYSFDRIPEAVKQWDVIGIAGVAILASMLGSLIPAYVAGRVWPVKVLRYE